MFIFAYFLATAMYDVRSHYVITCVRAGKENLSGTNIYIITAAQLEIERLYNLHEFVCFQS